MGYEWDENKRQSNLTKHGVDLLYAALIFEGPVLTKIDDRQNYREIREISLGMVDGKVYCVVHTKRGDRVRLISAWKGGSREYEQYQNGIP